MRYILFLLLFSANFSYAQPLGPPSYRYVGKIIDGKREGLYKIYIVYDFETSHLNSEGFYLNNQKYGEWKEYYSENKIRGIGNYLNDEKHGQWKYFDYYTGNIEKIEHYAKGKLHGEKLIYDAKSGALEEACTYANGVKTGEAREYYVVESSKSRDVFMDIGFYLNGKKQGEWKRYKENGQLVYVVNYLDGKRNGESKVYVKNILRKVCNYVNDELDGVCITYDCCEPEEIGKIFKIGQYKNGKAVGEWKVFWGNGDIRQIDIFEDGKLIESKEFKQKK